MTKLKNYSISLVISFIISLIFISLTAVIFAYTNINDRHLQSFIFGTLLISVLVGSTLLSRKIKEKGLLYGALFGVIYCLLMYFIAVIESGSFFVSNTLGLYLGICAVAGVIGGIIGVNI
ncbi:MAG: TIGR04086 family membrane protein [Clostridia bacterium]|nr:TIGR04086 family membrane protein [Clostridia bacterium]